MGSYIWPFDILSYKGTFEHTNFSQKQIWKNLNKHAQFKAEGVDLHEHPSHKFPYKYYAQNN